MNVFRFFLRFHLIRRQAVLAGTVLLASSLNLRASSFSVDSPVFRLRTNLSSPISAETGETQSLAYSTRWDSPESTAVRIAVTPSAGATTTLLSLSGTQEGQRNWTPTSPGYYTLVHETSASRSVQFQVGTLVAIIYNAEGGVPASQSQQHFLNAAYGSFPPAPTKTGYSFKGWYTAASGGTKVETSSVATASRTLHAQWTANKYTLTLDRQNGTGGSSSVVATYGSSMSTITVPTRVGYTFGGYWSAINGGGTQYFTASGASARTWNIASSTTLYAKWTARTYSVTLDAQGGSGGTARTTATFGSALPSVSIPKQMGFTFKGYFSAAGGAGTQYYTAAGTSARNWDRTAATTLFAHWEVTVLHVDASSGNDRNDGLSWQTAKATIQNAIDAADDGIRILVNDGVYEPISTVDLFDYPAGKSVEIVSVNGAAKTIIDGSLTWSRGVTNRVAYLGRTDQYTDEPVGSQAVLEGFTIRGGRPSGGSSPMGAGAYGGTLRHCIVTDNDSGSASGGGAACAILESCTISGNRAGYYGGGAFTCRLFDCLVENNVAGRNGGGTAGGRLERCIVRKNSAQYGGGHQGGEALDCLFEENVASLGGGAVAGANLSRCTVVRNRTEGIGGGAIGAVLHGSIVWNNAAGEYDDNCNTSQGAYNDTAPRLSGIGNIAADPLFRDPTSGDYRLQVSSPCVDAGFGPTDINRKDLAGNQRWQGVRMDMGAYEFANSFTPRFVAGDLWVDAKNGSDARSGATREEALATIAAAIDKAADGATIYVLPGTYASFTLDGRILTVRSTDGAEKTIVDGAGLSQCAWLGTDSQSILEGLTLCNGYVPMDGGGVWGGTLRDCVIRDNVADERGGGAVLARLERCVVHDNSARNGSGGGTFYCDLSNCLVYRNSAVSGGGVWSGGHFVANCTVVGNTATLQGGGIMSAGYVTNSIVWGNTAPDSPDLWGCDEWHLCSSKVDPGRESITDDPRFVDEAGGDFRLRPDSPCIDAGEPLVVSESGDLIGNPRSWGKSVDIGAYEFLASSPVHRFYSKNYKGHFFTIDEAEKDDLIAGNPNWRYEGVAYRAFTDQAPGTVALQRFYSKNYRGHFFTIDEEEAETIKRTNTRNWKYEGVAYYVYPQEIEGSVPVFRFWSKGYRHHFYTIDAQEKDSLIATNPNWKYEGVAFFAIPNEETAGAAVSAATERRMPKDECGTRKADLPLQTRPREDECRTPDAECGDFAGSPSDADAECGTLNAEWSLSAEGETKDSFVVIAIPGETEVGGTLVETRVDAPAAAELGSPVRTSAFRGRRFRLSLPSGVWSASLWSAAAGPLFDEDAEGAFFFDLPASGAWHWLRVRDAADAADAFSLWLYAE